MKIVHDKNPAAYITCAKTLRQGGIICYPTETFYALGADPFNKSACDRLFQLKNRDSEKELPLIAASTKMVSQICDTFDPRFKILSAKYWPGPLTIVLPSLGRFRSYAIRVSSNPVA